MEFQPKSEKELRNCLPAGEYDFEVCKAKDTQSQKGNDMIALTLRAFRPTGGGMLLVDDWLLAVPGCEYKLRHFCVAAGLLDLYESGTLEAAHCQGAAGKVRLGVEESDEFGDRNRVKDYVVPKTEKTEPESRKPADAPKQPATVPPDDETGKEPDDDIPF